jgi:hypothetical protein
MQMRARLQRAPAVALSTDGVHLTSQSQHYDAYDARFVDIATFTPQHLVLSVAAPEAVAVDSPLADEQRASAAADRLISLCDQFGITEKLTGITTDGPAAMRMSWVARVVRQLLSHPPHLYSETGARCACTQIIGSTS